MKWADHFQSTGRSTTCSEGKLKDSSRACRRKEQSINKNVVIVGEQWSVDRAQAYVEKVLWNAEHAPRGRDRGEGGADDGWGDEGEVEDWMKDYLYKRH